MQGSVGSTYTIDPGLAVSLLLLPLAHAHGMWGHVHVSGWAVENLPDDELRDFLLEPEVFNALVFGAAFTDTGYVNSEGPSRSYSEATHWEPFVEDFIQWIRVNDPPPWDDLASRKRVAFLMGCASHGLQDTLFDSLFLHQVSEQDGEWQEKADPGTDGFLVLDDHLRFVPETDLPMEALLELYADVDPSITAEVIEEAVGLVTAAYINDDVGPELAAFMGELYEDDIPWTRAHYLDQDVPASLRAEIYPTTRYLEAIWARLHGEFDADDVVTFAYPESPRRLASHEASSAASWVGLVFGAGVAYEDGLTELVDADGTAVPFTQANTQWNAADTRLVKLHPDEDLEPGGWYTVRLKSGAMLIDGQQTTQPWELSFQVDCLDEDEADCPDLELDEASIDGLPEDEDEDTGDGSPASGCGCGGPGPATPWMALALAALVRRRRRVEPS